MSGDDPEGGERYVERERTDRDEASSPGEGIEVPFERLSAAAQRGVIEEFVTREGTDYGQVEVPLEQKVAAVRRQIERGEVVLLFDPRTEQVNLIARRELARGR